MRSLLGSLILVLVSSCLTGCWFGGDPSPTPTTSTPVFTPPSSTPTPKWTDEEQGAIDAVQRYMDVWAHIAQNLGEVDLNEIYQVSMDPDADEQIQVFTQWSDKGWHLVGAPTFIPERVASGMINAEGHRHQVYGCVLTGDSYLVDSNETPVPTDNSTKRNAFIITVLHSLDNSDFVISNKPEGQPC